MGHSFLDISKSYALEIQEIDIHHHILWEPAGSIVKI